MVRFRGPVPTPTGSEVWTPKVKLDACKVLSVVTLSSDSSINSMMRGRFEMDATVGQSQITIKRWVKSRPAMPATPAWARAPPCTSVMPTKVREKPERENTLSILPGNAALTSSSEQGMVRGTSA